jgi:macrodomain Ter protein organizer (MatP/YcbG family)
MVTEDKKQDTHRKLIDIPLTIKAKLEKLAKKDRRDLKNYIEQQLILIVEAQKRMSKNMK